MTTIERDPEGPLKPLATQSLRSAYFLAAGLVAFASFAGAAGAGAAGAAAAAAGAVGAFNAARWSRSAVISALILSLRSASFAILALSFAIALEVLDTGAFLASGFNAGFAAFLEVFAALGAAFFAVATLNFLIVELANIFSSATHCLNLSDIAHQSGVSTYPTGRKSVAPMSHLQ